MPAALAATATAALLAACAHREPAGSHPRNQPTDAAPRQPAFARDGAGRALDGQSVRDPARPRVQRIAILPDRTTGRDWGLPYLEAAVEDLNIVRPDAVFTVGDMVQGYTRSPERWEREVHDYLSRVGALVPAFYPTPGNHDVISGSRAAGDRTFAERYRERFGPLWYSVELDLATAIVLFSDEGLGDGRIVLGDAQLAWLAGALDAAKARGRPIFLLMHRPLWRSASVRWQERVQPLLERAGADAVIAGHFHALQRDPDAGGVQYHIVGTCGGMIDQHPLAGQLQHLTFVDCSADGALRVWHQPVGMVLPEDFVVRADQDRVWRLREPSAVRSAGTLPDPGALPAPAPATVRLELRNPVDVPVRFTLEPPGVLGTPGGTPVWWTAGRAGRGTAGAAGGANGWTSHAPADIDNAHTMSTNARAVVTTAPGALRAEVPPGAARTVEVPVTLLPQRPDGVLVPQLDVYATFVDTKGRTVPVWLPTRLPVARTVRTGADATSAPPYAALAWDYSPYDTREENPRIRVIAAPGGGALTIDVTVPDDACAAAPEWIEPDDRRRANPHADAVRIVLGRGGAPVLDRSIEPFTPGAPASADGVRWEASRLESRGWRLQATVDLPAGGPPDAIQVGIADNDDTYHTQWRWLAPGGSGGGWPLAAGTSP